MPKIFISYRREDSAAMAGRLFDRLEAHFGRGSVFIDVDSIPLGVDFRDHLADAVNKCDALLAIIGDAWGAAGRIGDAGLNDPNDFIRIEIEAALARDIPVIPVLIGRTSMPLAHDLPSSLRPLAYRNACTVESGPDFRAQVDRLIRNLERCNTPSAQPLSDGAIGKPAGPEGASRSVATSRGSSMLLVVSGPKKHTTFELTKDRVLIGRSEACDVFLDDATLSNYHAQLVRTDGGYSLEDLGSANGSYLNGECVRDRVPLNDGDRIHTGKVILQYRRPEVRT